MTHSASICHNRIEQASDIRSGISYSGCSGKFLTAFNDQIKKSGCLWRFFLKSSTVSRFLMQIKLPKKQKGSYCVNKKHAWASLLCTAHAFQSTPAQQLFCITRQGCLFMLVWKSHQEIFLLPLLSDEVAYPPYLSLKPEVMREWQSRLQLSQYEAYQTVPEKR